jgi:hypothetical protein
MEGKYIGGNDVEKPAYQTIDFNKLFTIFKKKTAEVKLNDQYSAVVRKDRITVGCQTFPIGIIDELVKARQSVQE